MSQPTPTATGKPDTESSLVPSADGTESAAPKTPVGSLAHTGANATPWILGGAGILLAGGIGAVVAARRRQGSEAAETN